MPLAARFFPCKRSDWPLSLGRSCSEPRAPGALVLALSSLIIGVVAACSSDDAPAPLTSSNVDAGTVVDSSTSSEASNSDGATSKEDASVVTGVSITSAGGTFQVGAATVTVPAGAVAADTPVTLTLSTAPPAGSGLAGAQILTDILVATPHGTTFTKPIVVELPLKSGVNPPPSAEAWTLADDADTTWEKLTAATITSNKVRYETTHFSWSIGVYWPPAVVDGGTDSAVDGGGDGGGFVSPECFVYSAGGSSVGATIHRAADRLYWIGAAGAAAKNVHSVKTDLTDYKKYANPGGSLGVTSNANGVFWSENFPPADAGVSAGLYLLATSGGTPTFQASSSFTGAMTATATNVFRLAMVGVDWTLQRSDALGQNAEVVLYTTADQVEAASGYVYWINSTYAATNTFCATAGNKMPPDSAGGHQRNRARHRAALRRWLRHPSHHWSCLGEAHALRDRRCPHLRPERRRRDLEDTRRWRHAGTPVPAVFPEQEHG